MKITLKLTEQGLPIPSTTELPTKPLDTTETVPTTTISTIATTFSTTNATMTNLEEREARGLEWFLQRPWMVKPDEETLTSEEVRWIQIQLVLSIIIVSSILLAIIGCSCLRIPTLLIRGGRHLTHALRIWKAKLPGPTEWSVWTAIVAVFSGLGHCLLCCLYKKDVVPEKATEQPAAEFEMVELGTITNQNYREPVYATLKKKKDTKTVELYPEWPETETLARETLRRSKKAKSPTPSPRTFTSTAEVHLSSDNRQPEAQGQ